MRIIVCIKQVPNTNEVRLDPKTGTMIREGIPSIINPDDRHALEAALSIKDKTGATVTVISMGPPQADFALREALAIGADEAVLLSDRAFAGADTWATSLTLAKAIQRFKDYSLILCGSQAIDGDTAQVGPELAEHLDLPQVTYVKRIAAINDDSITVQRALEDGYAEVTTSIPAVLTVVRGINHPRYPRADGIVAAFETKEVEVWALKDLGLGEDKVGLKGSLTQVKRTFSPPVKGSGKMLPGTKDAVITLIQELHEKHVL